jgi:hypothetical protein
MFLKVKNSYADIGFLKLPLKIHCGHFAHRHANPETIPIAGCINP